MRQLLHDLRRVFYGWNDARTCEILCSHKAERIKLCGSRKSHISATYSLTRLFIWYSCGGGILMSQTKKTTATFFLPELACKQKLKLLQLVILQNLVSAWFGLLQSMPCSRTASMFAVNSTVRQYYPFSRCIERVDGQRYKIQTQIGNFGRVTTRQICLDCTFERA